MSWKLDDFYNNLFDKKLFVKLPERGDDSLTAATKLLEIRREMSEVEQALAAQKDEFQLKMDNLERRREDLQRKEHLLKESLIRFDKFVKENDAKKQRAIKRQASERDSRLTKEKEIDHLKHRIAALDMQKLEIAARAHRYERFQNFLEKTVEVSSEFHEIRELMGRFDTLITTHESLLVTDQENQAKIQNEKQEHSLYVEDKLNEKLRATAMLSELQDKIDELESECHKLETVWSQIQSSAATRTLVLGRIRMSTYNIFLRAQELHALHVQEMHDRPESDTAGQLKDIQRCLLDLTDIANQAKQLVLDEYHTAASHSEMVAASARSATNAKTSRSRP